MDNYGYLELEDAPTIAKAINDGNNVVFNYSLGNGAAFVITITPHLKLLNRIDHGSPYNRIFVGILLRGYFHFDPALKQYPNYVGEKLNLHDADAILIADLLNAVFALLVNHGQHN